MNARIVQLMLVPLCIYAVLASVLIAPVALKWQKRASWHRWEVLTCFAPILLWAGLIIADGRGKSLSNLVVEPFYLALSVAAITWSRVAFAPSLQPSRAAAYGALLALSASWLVWWVVPGLPE